MSTAIVKIDDSLESKLELIKRTVAVGASDDELALFMHQCKKTGLDPLARQIYFVKRQGKGTIQTGIDGYRLVAERSGKYAGNDDPVFEDLAGAKNPQKATVTIWKLVGNKRCPYTASARWSEYYPGDAQGWMWKKMPYLMLGKVAEALALRKAFPAELSGVYTHDEMSQAEPHINTLVGCCGLCGKETPLDVTLCQECTEKGGRKALTSGTTEGVADTPKPNQASASGVTSESAPVAPTLSEVSGKVIQELPPTKSKWKFWLLEGDIFIGADGENAKRLAGSLGRRIEVTGITVMKNNREVFQVEDVIHIGALIPNPLEVTDEDTESLLKESIRMVNEAKGKKDEDLPF